MLKHSESLQVKVYSSCVEPHISLFSIDASRRGFRVYDTTSCVCVCVCVCVYVCVCSVTRLCPTLCDPMGYSPPGSSIHGILQARILEWLPSSTPGHLPDPGNQIQASCNLCIGKQILYYGATPPGKRYDVLQSY